MSQRIGLAMWKWAILFYSLSKQSTPEVLPGAGVYYQSGAEWHSKESFSVEKNINKQDVVLLHRVTTET